MACPPTDPKLTAYELKELLIERYELSHLEDIMSCGSRDPIDFDKTYHNLAVLDLDMLDISRMHPQTGNDMASTHWNLAIEHQKLKLGDLKWMQAMQDPKVRDEVIQLLNAEVRACRPDLEGEIEKMTGSTKIIRIINHRLEKGIVRLPRPKRSKTKTKTEFHISLTTLIDGDGSSCRSSEMHIKAETSFEEFLNTLRIETQYCRMPEAYPPPFDDSDPFEVQNSSTLALGSSFGGESSDQGNSQTSFRTAPEMFDSQDTWVTADTSHTLEGDDINQKAPRQVLGFTLADGPWMYFVAYREEGKVRTALKRLGSEDDYREMVNHLTLPGTESCAVITHSKECERQTLWKRELAEEEADQARMRQEIRGLDPFGDGDEEDVGEDYMIVMRKKNNRSAELWTGRVFPLF